MATVSNLVVKLSTDNRRLNSGLNKARSSLNSFAKSSRKALNTVGTALTAGLVAAASLAVLQIKKVSEEIDSLSKTALLLNVGVNELQKLQFAAQKAGIETRTLNLGLQRMTRRIGEASRGTGEAAEAIKSLGLNARELSKLPLEQQFQKVAKALGTVKNESEQLSLAFKFFDSEGARILNVVRLGAEKLGKEFDGLNLGITDAEAKSVEEMNDRFTDLSTIIKSIKQLTVAFLAPAITEATSAIVDYVKQAGGARAVTKGVASGLLDMAEFGTKAFFVMTTFSDRLALSLGVIMDTLLRVKNTFGSIGKGISAAIRNLDSDSSAGSFLGELAYNTINFKESQQFDTSVAREIRDNQAAINLIQQSRNVAYEKELEALEKINKARQRTLNIEEDIKKAVKNQKNGGFSGVTGDLVNGSSGTQSTAANRVFKTRDEFGNVSFSRNAPQTAKSVVELRLVGSETKKLIKAEVREEVEQATRFDRN